MIAHQRERLRRTEERMGWVGRDEQTVKIIQGRRAGLKNSTTMTRKSNANR